jgi:putative phosphoesterase
VPILVMRFDCRKVVAVRVAVLNDIHGNLPALEAVLDDLPPGVDRVVVGGDVFPGPTPHLVLDRFKSLAAPVDFIYGNGEVAVLEYLAGKTPAMPKAYLPLIAWNVDRLTDAARRMVASWPMTLRLHMPAFGDVLFCHATPRNENEIFTALTAEERLVSIFDAANADLVVCGHTHIQFDRQVGKTRVVNAGSVGMPFGAPGADWLVLDDRIELRHTSYDLQAAADSILQSGYPGGGEFASTFVLNPPSAEQMLLRYQQHELGTSD